MHELNLEAINWDNPSKQDIVDLYYARMWAISEAVALFLQEEKRPPRWFIDDIRTNFLQYTNLTRLKFDSLINEGAHILTEWGIPDVFLVAPHQGFNNEPEDGEYVEATIYTHDDMAVEFANNDASHNALVLAVMTTEYKIATSASGVIEEKFIDIVNPTGAQNAN